MTIRQTIQASEQLKDLPPPHEYVATGSRHSAGNPYIEMFGRHILEVPNFREKCASNLPLPPPKGIEVLGNSVLMAMEIAHLHTAVYPTPFLLALYPRLLELKTLSYLNRNPLRNQEFTRTAHFLSSRAPGEIESTLESTKCPANPLSLMIVGPSGVGKTFGVEFVLNQFQQVCRHKVYNGVAFDQVQILWLHVQCPPTGTLKALLLEILLRLDLLLGTGYYLAWLNSHASTDVILVNVALILYTHGLGCLVLDELQHLKAQAYKNTETTLNFFVSLMNFLGVPLVSIGTYAALDVLSGTLRDARRLSGLGQLDCKRYEQHERTTRALQDFYLSFLPGFGQRAVPMAFQDDIYHIYQGFHFLLPNLVHRCIVEASFRGENHVTPEILTHYKNEELRPVSRALQALRTNDVDEISLYDDLMSPQAIKALKSYQTRTEKERHAPKDARLPTSSTRTTTETSEEFSADKFSDDEVLHQCSETVRIFGQGDLYPTFKKKGLIASSIVHGQVSRDATAST